MDTPLPTPGEMAHWDHRAIHEAGLLGELLMENASREALRVLCSRGPQPEGSFILFFAGSGNNGGDAFALARQAHDLGANCLVLHTRDLEEYKGEALYHARLCRDCGVDTARLGEVDLKALPLPDAVVDGLLGTGFTGQLRQDYLDWIDWINRVGQSAFVLALDIPSGLSGESGMPGGDAVRAHCTVTFQAAKTGLFFPQAAKYLGELHTASIGIPRWIRQESPPSVFGINEEVFDHLPRPDPLMHKGKAGHVLIIGGSPALSGAPALAGLGALRAGAGLVTVACPEGISGEIKQSIPEMMSLPIDSQLAWSRQAFSALGKELSGFDAVVLGPGMGRDSGALEFVRSYLKGTCLPTVLDADALFALAQEKELLSNLSREDVITPHPGEMGRLQDTGTDQVQADRIATARKAAREAGCGVVLKGAGSVVSHPEYADRLSPFSCFSLALGGSGDVLSGIIGSLLARGVPVLEAACLGVYWHGKAGAALCSQYPWRGNLAREIAHELPRCINNQVLERAI